MYDEKMYNEKMKYEKKAQIKIAEALGRLLGAALLAPHGQLPRKLVVELSKAGQYWVYPLGQPATQGIACQTLADVSQAIDTLLHQQDAEDETSMPTL